MPKTCPKCKNYMSEDEDTYYCNWCDHEEFKTIVVKYKEDI